MIDRFNALLVSTTLDLQERATAALRREDGQTFAEYALVLAVVAVIAGVVLAAAKTPLTDLVTTAIAKVKTAITTAA